MKIKSWKWMKALPIPEDEEKKYVVSYSALSLQNGWNSLSRNSLGALFAVYKVCMYTYFI